MYDHVPEEKLSPYEERISSLQEKLDTTIGKPTLFTYGMKLGKNVARNKILIDRSFQIIDSWNGQRIMMEPETRLALSEIASSFEKLTPEQRVKFIRLFSKMGEITALSLINTVSERLTLLSENETVEFWRLLREPQADIASTSEPPPVSTGVMSRLRSFFCFS